jgi:hypothetical protein
MVNRLFKQKFYSKILGLTLKQVITPRIRFKIACRRNDADHNSIRLWDQSTKEIESWYLVDEYIANEHFILGSYSDIYHTTWKNIRFIGTDEYNANG